MSVRVRFTRNGDDVPGRPADPAIGVGGVHFDFTPGEALPEFWYTKDKQIIGEKHAAPKEATDVGLEWGTGDDGQLQMTTNWTDAKKETINGSKGYVKSPDGADDWHLDLHGGTITAAEWTHDGGKSYTQKQPLEVPKDADDAHVTIAVGHTKSHLALIGSSGSAEASRAEIVLLAGATAVAFKEGLDAPGQPCGVAFTTTGEGTGTDSGAALDAAYTKAALAAGLVCTRNKSNGCDATEFVRYMKVSFGGAKSAVTCTREAEFKCVKDRSF